MVENKGINIKHKTLITFNTSWMSLEVRVLVNLTWPKLGVMAWKQTRLKKEMMGKIRYISYWLLRLQESAQTLQKISHGGLSFLSVVRGLWEMPQIPKETHLLPCPLPWPLLSSSMNAKLLLCISKLMDSILHVRDGVQRWKNTFPWGIFSWDHS